MAGLFGEVPRFQPRRQSLPLDLYARKVVVASLLYYRHDHSLMSDATFDAMCVDLSNYWKDLSPIRQFMLGSARLIKSSGNHIKVTRLAEASAYSWMSEHGLEPSEIGPITKWKYDKVHRVEWAEVSS